MFTNDMKESRQGVIEMRDIDAKYVLSRIPSFANACELLCFSALEALINFVYSGRLHLDRNNVQSIMMGASFLQLINVKDACATFLLKR